ncbi:MAG TPA: FAD-dependent monooxygenase [Terriglobales bacterium]|nr:FAD-dependent monooxygenase [Terriglobales bacterium]
MHSSLYDTEVFVAGGGPAGLAAAIALRQQGFEVMLADAARPPIDKACGEGIMPDGLAALSGLGIVIPAEDGYTFRGIRFSDEQAGVHANFPQGRGMGIRRTVLHQRMVDKAGELGAQMLWRAQVNGLTEKGVLVNRREVRCRWIVGADGQNSRVRSWAGLDAGSGSAWRFGFRKHFAIAPWSDFVEVFWTQYGQVYVTPVGPKEICVALVTRRREHRLTDVLRECRSLPAELREQLSYTREQGAVSATRRLASVSNRRCVLIGEASGSVDAVTGQGLSIAFQQAVAMASAIRNNDLGQYESAHRRLMRMPRAMSAVMLVMDRWHALRRRSLRALSADPTLFDRLLAVHTGATSPLGVGVSAAAALGWQFIRA